MLHLWQSLSHHKPYGCRSFVLKSDQNPKRSITLGHDTLCFIMYVTFHHGMLSVTKVHFARQDFLNRNRIEQENFTNVASKKQWIVGKLKCEHPLQIKERRNEMYSWVFTWLWDECGMIMWAVQGWLVMDVWWRCVKICIQIHTPRN